MLSFFANISFKLLYSFFCTKSTIKIVVAQAAQAHRTRHGAILIGRLRQCGIVDSTRGDPGCQHKLLLTNCVRVPRESVWQGDEVTKPISTVVVPWWSSTRVSSNILLFHRGNKLPPGFARRDAIAWLKS